MTQRLPRWLRRTILTALMGACLLGISQWPVHFRAGMNHRVQVYTVALYLKLARFVARDLEYRHLVHELTAGITDDETKTVRLYAWVRGHIHSGTPAELPVVDDHVWSIIVRGYGEPDQLADVLATLCVYSGIPAVSTALAPPGGRPLHSITMVYVRGHWCPVDPFYGILLRDPAQRLLSRETLMAHPEWVRAATEKLIVEGVPYARLYESLPAPVLTMTLRPYWHQPFWRAWGEIVRGYQRLSTGVARRIQVVVN